ncbi:MAG: DUF2442 domain-containing protein [Synergistaceae bacterium]|nr:DUF2442 domain-containing protein [Synergistaceae bacterium]
MEIIHGEEEMLPRVSGVETDSDYNLVVTFRNGERKIYDAKPLLQLPMYKNLAKVFRSARVEYGTVVWPGDIDISPDTLYLKGTAL